MPARPHRDIWGGVNAQGMLDESDTTVFAGAAAGAGVGTR